jgi:radical SAM superfamily enzyme YgiQ (UPF0313 family)
LRVLLISTYDLGRQPFGLASPAAMLAAQGHEVTCADASLDPVPAEAARQAGLIAFFLPMHTATRLAAPLIGRARECNPRAILCAYGLYAPLNAGYLRGLGIDVVLGGEFEPRLCDLARGGITAPAGPELDRVAFQKPDRAGLPPLARYAGMVVDGVRRVTGYTEASRGCKHLCRHCPVVPVYQGRFRAVPVEVVLADIRQQIDAGARHITFGDPYFFNGPRHAARIVEALSREFSDITYDATIKIEHLLKHRGLLPLLRRTGCTLITSAVESVDDSVLMRLRKDHTRADFYEAVRLCRENGIALSPTFIPFTPWTTRDAYCELLRSIAGLHLIDHVAPIQLALRLLIPNGSPLLDLEEIRAVVTDFDPASLTHRWRHADPAMDEMAAGMLSLVHREERRGASRAEYFAAIWERAGAGPPDWYPMSRAAIPYLTEPWYC